MSVVVGVDGSAACLGAIRVAAQEARFRRTELIAVMAYSGDRSVRDSSGQPVGTVVRGDEQAQALSSLRHVVSAALGSGQVERVQLRVVAGTAGRQILETAREARAQLIVLATRGSVSLLLGTVSQYVLRRATCPVLVVPPATPAG
ncbi:MAG TPA: universal stress protein [Streptosporangiaceae bacterium]|jgi:nucleotide-binding universal stress UspA family protein|nr:universal stress protein [Streptosporangiaceae bacterium]